MKSPVPTGGSEGVKSPMPTRSEGVKSPVPTGSSESVKSPVPTRSEGVKSPVPTGGSEGVKSPVPTGGSEGVKSPVPTGGSEGVKSTRSEGVKSSLPTHLACSVLPNSATCDRTLDIKASVAREVEPCCSGSSEVPIVQLSSHSYNYVTYGAYRENVPVHHLPEGEDALSMLSSFLNESSTSHDTRSCRSWSTGLDRQSSLSSMEENLCKIVMINRASRSKPHTTEFYPFLGMLCIIVRPLAKCTCEMFHVKHGVGAPPPYREVLRSVTWTGYHSK